MFPEHYSFASYVNPEKSRGEITVLFSGEARPMELHNTGPGVHDYYLFHTVTAGNGDFMLDGKRYICGAGDTFMIFPGSLHQYVAAARQPWEYVWVAFQGHRCEPLLQQLGLTPERPVVRGSGTRNALALYRRLRSSLRDAEHPALADLEAAGCLRLLLRELALAEPDRLPAPPTAGTAARRQVEQAMRWLELQYAQPISIEQLSKSLGYHRTHLSKMFKDAIGLSPMQFLMQIRLERAKSLLRSHWSVEQVASSVGFADALYFSKQFRKRFGMSPTEYRQRQ
ncbi:AraC family transcriptional regulator [Paenibacillus antri]|uniref:AraC family transcriptional regulator n=1 Tax=Paenibacillus antri TaxID=2582848 RepID=A0A5R9G7E4_9BACL|nr:AraC family transcriptional regulator [Paenibacillus antri]TLS50999.1 AraC family transcriptional regulator [Paenibacillus antri]